jgi:hypothetical protein
VRLDLEDTSARTVSIRDEFRPQLVRLGILAQPGLDPLERRERARGFEPGFSPSPAVGIEAKQVVCIGAAKHPMDPDRPT